MSGFWESLMIGILGSVVASVVFLFFMLWYYRPNLKISPEISKIIVDGRAIYGFKFVNLTRHPLFDVRCELQHCKPDFNGVKENRDSKKIELIRDNLLYIPAEVKKDKTSLHAIIIHTKEDLDSKIDGNSFVSLTIVARHQLSGSTKLFREDFMGASIKIGRHKSGNHYEVISTSKA